MLHFIPLTAEAMGIVAAVCTALGVFIGRLSMRKSQ